MTTNKNERLAVLSPAEQDALYGLPDFDDAQLWPLSRWSAAPSGADR